MKRLLLVFVPFILWGCCIHGPGIHAARGGWELIKPEYVAYLAADTDLDGPQKDNRHATADLLSKLLAELDKGYLGAE